MRDNNYYTIFGFMVNQLNLKGNKLHIYAVIYGFSQDGETEYSGGIKYLMDTLSLSKPSVINTLFELVDENLITKREYSNNNIIRNNYKCNLELIGKNFLPIAGKEILPTTGKKILPKNNNIRNIIKESLITREEIDNIVKTELKDEEVSNWFLKYVDNRIAMGKKCEIKTKDALLLNIKRLRKYANSKEQAIELLQQTIERNYQGICDLLKNVNKTKSTYNPLDGIKYAN